MFFINPDRACFNRAAILFTALIFFLCGCSEEPLYRSGRVMMGTYVEVVSPDPQAAGIVFEKIAYAEKLFSKYEEDSEISRLNREGRVKASPETFYIFKKALEFCNASGGAFDITVGQLMDLWGFTDNKFKVPSADEISRKLAVTGTDKIVFHERDNVIEFSVPGMEVDLGAIAKGYAVDLSIEELKRKNIANCLVNAGGDIYCLGAKKGRGWKVAIQDPDSHGYKGFLYLKDKAVATSGNYEQYFLSEGRKYSHIIDPKTGYPVEGSIVSVTVIAEDCLTADALATAVFSLGRKRGMEMAKNYPSVEIKIIEKRDKQ